jgi:murein DD-endopeptidase MepM/ murein hydrolase activator NlpD
MKNKNKFMEFLNSKGFFTALFTCLFAVMAIAAFASIRNIDALTRLNNVNPADPTYHEHITAIDNELAAAGIQHDRRLSEITARPNENTNSEEEDAEDDITDDTKDEEPKDDETVWKIEAENAEPMEEDNEIQESESTDVSQSDIVIAETVSSVPEEQLYFADGDKMNWPLDGTIVMNFSANRTIYDKTLDQYRTNNTISLGTDMGTQVKAAADGTVSSITIDPRMGLTIAIDHGNGWSTKYGQLQETVLVQEGQALLKGKQ